MISAGTVVANFDAKIGSFVRANQQAARSMQQIATTAADTRRYLTEASKAAGSWQKSTAAISAATRQYNELAAAQKRVNDETRRSRAATQPRGAGGSGGAGVSADGEGRVRRLTDALRGMRDEVGANQAAFNQLFAGAALYAGLNILEDLFSRVKAFVDQSIEAAARVEELAIVQDLLGDKAGMSTLVLDQQVEALKDLGIESKAAYDSVNQFLKQGLPIDQLSDIAGAARDFGVLAGADTTETLNRIIWGAQTRQPEVLRTAGINISPEQEMGQYAAELGKTVMQLTEAEKVQAIFNGVIDEGKNVLGAYEMAMETAGKQSRSTARYVEELKNSLGEFFQPLFEASVHIKNTWLKALTELVEDSPVLRALESLFDEMGERASEFSDKVLAGLEGFNQSGALVLFDRLRTTLEAIGGPALAAVAGGFTNLARQLPIIGQLLGPLSGWQTALATLVVTNEGLRSAAGDVLRILGETAVVVSTQLEPVFVQLSDWLDRNADTLGELARQAAEGAAMFATLAATLTSAVAPIIFKLLDGVAKLVDLLNELHIVTGVAVIALGGLAAVKLAGVAGDIAKITKFMHELRVAAKLTRTEMALMGVGFAAAAVGIGILADRWMDAERAQRDYTDSVERTLRAAVEREGFVEASRLQLEQLALLEQQVASVDRAIDQAGDGSGFLGKLGANALGFLTNNDFARTALGAAGVDILELPQEQLEAQRAALQTLSDEVIAGFEDYAGAAAAAAEERSLEIESAVEIIRNTLGEAAVDFVDVENLTTAQLKNLEQTIGEFQKSVQKWSEDVTSFAGALKDKEIQDWDDLMAFYDTQYRNVVNFWADIETLRQAGLNEAAVQDLISAGPEAVGGMLGHLVDTGMAKGSEWIEQQIADLNFASEEIQRISQDQARATATAILAEGGAFRANTQAEIEAVSNELVGLRSEIESQAMMMMASSQAFVNVAAEGAAAAAAEAQAAINAFIATVSDPAATQAELHAALQAVVTEAMEYAAADPAQRAGVDAMVSMANSMLSNRATAVVAGEAVGLSVGEALSSALNAEVGAAVAEATNTLTRLGTIGGKAWFQSEKGGSGGGWWASGARGAASSAAAAAAAAVRQASTATQRLPRSSFDPTRGAAAAAKKAAAAQRDLGDAVREAAQAVRDAAVPWDQYVEALDKVYGAFASYELAVDSSRNAAEDYAQSLIDIANSGESASRRQRMLRLETSQLLAAVNAEAEAAVKAGRIRNTVGDITHYVSKRTAELQKQLPTLVRQFEREAAAIGDVEAALESFRNAMDKTLNLSIDSEEATFSREDAFDRLMQTYQDEQALLTGIYLSEKDRHDIKKTTKRELHAYVRALQTEAEWLAKTGEIGADAASQQEYIRQKLAEIGEEMPDLVDEVGDYNKELRRIPDEVETMVRADITDAQKQIASFQARLSQVPRTATVLLQAKVDAASLAAAQRTLNSQRGSATISPYVNTGTVSAGRMQVNTPTMNITANQGTASFSGTYVPRPYAGKNGGYGYMDVGGILPPGEHLIKNATARNEHILTAKQYERLMDMATGAGGGRPSGGGGAGVVVKGDLNVVADNERMSSEQLARHLYRELTRR